MPKFPSQEDIDAANATLQPYLLALGKVANSWNHLHEELGKVFCALTGLDISVGMAIWHSLKSDRSHRDILEGALKSRAADEEWTQQNPNAVKGITYLLNKVQELASKRNNAIHAPCDALPSGEDFEIKPITFFGNKLAKNLIGKDILKEFQWYEKTADALLGHAWGVRFALDSHGTWPDKPDLPTLGQEDSPGQ